MLTKIFTRNNCMYIHTQMCTHTHTHTHMYAFDFIHTDVIGEVVVFGDPAALSNWRVLAALASVCFGCY